MITSNIHLGRNIRVPKGSSLNNVKIGDNTKLASEVKLFGSEDNILEVGEGCYFGMNCFIEGYNAKVIIGDFVSFSPMVTIISGSGPNASELMQRIYPITKGPVNIGDHCWIGGNSVITPNVSIGKFCIVGSNSFVNKSFPDYSVIGGTPAKLIRTLSDSEKEKLHSND